MALYKIKDFDPDYRNHFDGQDILSYDVYSQNDKVGSIKDVLVDEQGQFRYFVVDTGPWIFGKQVLLPVGRAQLNHENNRVYATRLTREQVENLPEYNPDTVTDYDYEERVRNIYRPTATVPAERSASVENTPPVSANRQRYDRSSYRYDEHDPELYSRNDRDHKNIRLYEERLIASKTRRKAGEVSVGKRVETDTAHASIPVEKERVVIERKAPTDPNASASDHAFREGEVARTEVYEEEPNIHKETRVREEVSVRKEVERDQAQAQETVRRERLDIDGDRNVIQDKSNADRTRR